MKKVKFDFDATKQNIFVNQNAAVPVGAPVDQIGAVANNGNAIGIVIGAKKQVISGRFVKNLVVMVAGYCDIIDAQEIWGDEYSAEAIAAMSDITFCDNHELPTGGGGGWPADLPKPSVGGYGYTESGETTLASETVTTASDGEGVSGEFATSFDIVDGVYTVIFNGTEYNLNSALYEEAGIWYLGDFDGRHIDFSRYPFLIAVVGVKTQLSTESPGDYDVTIKMESETIHKIDEKYLPASGGATILHIDVTGVDIDTMTAVFDADKTVEEMKYYSTIAPTWCVVHIPESIIGSDLTIGVPPAFSFGGFPCFGHQVSVREDLDPNLFFVEGTRRGWDVHLEYLG